MMEPETATVPVKRKRSLNRITNLQKPAANGTVESAIDGPQSAVISTSVQTVEGNTCNWNIRRKIELSTEYMHPKFTQDLIWGSVEDDISPSAHYSLFAEPLPCPPHSELGNLVANKTIREHPELFKIICNIKTKKFKELLKDHPNQPFVQSVITGLTEGFWPWAEPQDGYPLTHNEPQHPPRNDHEHDFMLSLSMRKRSKHIVSPSLLIPSCLE
jgi:hypothetical protein